MNTTKDESHQPAPPVGVSSSEGLGLAPERDLVERLRSRRNFMSTDALRWYMTATPDGDCEEAAAEIERLRAALAKANEQAERLACSGTKVVTTSSNGSGLIEAPCLACEDEDDGRWPPR